MIKIEVEIWFHKHSPKLNSSSIMDFGLETIVERRTIVVYILTGHGSNLNISMAVMYEVDHCIVIEIVFDVRDFWKFVTLCEENPSVVGLSQRAIHSGILCFLCCLHIDRSRKQPQYFHGRDVWGWSLCRDRNSFWCHRFLEVLQNNPSRCRWNWMKIVLFWLEFHWSLYSSLKLMISRRWST